MKKNSEETKEQIIDQATQELKEEAVHNSIVIDVISNTYDKENLTERLEQDFDINAYNERGDTLLLDVLQKKPVNVDFVEFLLEQDGIDVNSTGDSIKKKTALMYAAEVKPESDAIQLCEMLIEAGAANVACCDQEWCNWKAADFARSAKNFEVKTMLLGETFEEFMIMSDQ